MNNRMRFNIELATDTLLANLARCPPENQKALVKNLLYCAIRDASDDISTVASIAKDDYMEHLFEQAK